MTMFVSIVSWTIFGMTVWTFWQVISLLVWRKQNAPTKPKSCFSFWRSFPVTRPKWLPFTGPDISLKSQLVTLTDSYKSLDARHTACVSEFTSKLRAICPHADTTLEETEDYRKMIYAVSWLGPATYGRRTVETCDDCGKVLEDVFEEYEDQTLPTGYVLGVDKAQGGCY